LRIESGHYEVWIMGKPLIGSLKPNRGVRGAALSVRISGDGMTGVLRCEMGPGIAIRHLEVLGDAAVKVEIAIASEADPGPRDVTLAKEKLAETGTLRGGFQVE
jgi:hypothetical protein